MFNDRNRKTLKFGDFEVRFEAENGLSLNIFKVSGFKRTTPHRWRNNDLYLETPQDAYLVAELNDNIAISLNGVPVTDTKTLLKGSNVIEVRVKDDNGGAEYHVNIHTVRVPTTHKSARPRAVSYNEAEDCFFFEDALWYMFWLDSFYYDDPYLWQEELHWEAHDEWDGEFAEFNDLERPLPVPEPAESLSVEAVEETHSYTPEPEPEPTRYEAPVHHEPEPHSYTPDPEPDTKNWGGWGGDSGGSSWDSGSSGGGWDSGDSGGGDCGGCD